MNLGQRAAADGFSTVKYLDTSRGQPGVLVTHPFNPEGITPEDRYGLAPGTVFTFVHEQYVGAHSVDRDHIAAPLLYKEALGVDAGPWDIWDLDLVEGLTAKVIAEMNAKGLKTPDEQAGPGGSVSGAIVAQLQAANAALQAKIDKLTSEVAAAKAEAQAGIHQIDQAVGHSTGGGKPAMLGRTYLQSVIDHLPG